MGGGVVEDCGSDDCRSGNSDDTSGECDGTRELWNVPAPHPVADGGPKDLAKERPSEYAFEGNGLIM